MLTFPTLFYGTTNLFFLILDFHYFSTLLYHSHPLKSKHSIVSTVLKIRKMNFWVFYNLTIYNVLNGHRHRNKVIIILIPIHQTPNCNCDIITSIQTDILAGFNQSEKCQCCFNSLFATKKQRVFPMNCKRTDGSFHKHIVYGVLGILPIALKFFPTIDHIIQRLPHYLTVIKFLLALPNQIHPSHFHLLADCNP